jgi:hypothetical protein
MKNSLTMAVAIVMLLGCNNDPDENYPATPEIKFTAIRFLDSSEPGRRPDTLQLVFSFTDGDQDFGLDPADIQFTSNPYHPKNYFQEDNGNVQIVSTNTIMTSNNDRYEILDIGNPNSGKMVFPRTRKQAQYQTLPAYSCSDYTLTEYVILRATDKSVLDKNSRIIDSLQIDGLKYYRFTDTLMFTKNSSFYNIDVDYFVDEGNGLEEFDIAKKYCAYDFYARLPNTCSDNRCLSFHNGPFRVKMFSSQRGEITYNMAGLFFKQFINDKPIKLKVRIRDRALNESNVIETPEFRLSEI